MRIHENRTLFVKAQQNAQRRKLDDLLAGCPIHITERILTARQISFPATSESIKHNLPLQSNASEAEKPYSATYQFSEVADARKALKKIEDTVAGFPDAVIYLSLGEFGGMSFGDEQFVDLALPMFAARPSHWIGLWSELFDLGGNCMSVVAEDNSFGIIVGCSRERDVCGTVFEIGSWNDSQNS